MKKILALLMALLIITACAAEENYEEESSGADITVSEESESSEKSVETSHSSEQSSAQSETSYSEGSFSDNSQSTAGAGGACSETSSMPEIVSSNPALAPIIPGGSGFSNNVQPIENSWVKRADSRVPGGESLIKSLAVNRTYAENDDRLILMFNNEKSVREFVEEAEKIFQLGEGEGSFRELLLSYDDDYFYNNTLLVAYLPVSSGSVKYEVAGYSISENMFSLCINAKVPEVGTADMADYFAVAECSHKELGDCNMFAVDISF